MWERTFELFYGKVEGSSVPAAQAFSEPARVMELGPPRTPGSAPQGPETPGGGSSKLPTPSPLVLSTVQGMYMWVLSGSALASSFFFFFFPVTS